jgi:hypothetical protein
MISLPGGFVRRRAGLIQFVRHHRPPTRHRTKPRQVPKISALTLRNHPAEIVTSNKPFGRWGEVFGDDVVAAAMIDRLVHHAEVVALKGDSYRLKDRDLGRTTTEAD